MGLETDTTRIMADHGIIPAETLDPIEAARATAGKFGHPADTRQLRTSNEPAASALSRIPNATGQGQDSGELAGLAMGGLIEREAAAQIAERDCDWSAFGKSGIPEWDGGPDGIRDYRLGIRVGRAIAAAIRSLPAAQPAQDGEKVAYDGLDMPVLDCCKMLAEIWSQHAVSEKSPTFSRGDARYHRDVFRAAAAEVERLRAERENADQSLVDRYRDPKSGRFDFPGDVAKIVRSLDDATVASERKDAEIARLREALTGLECACEQLAATRTHEVYLAMIDSGQGDALISLDARRQSARAALRAEQKGDA